MADAARGWLTRIVSGGEQQPSALLAPIQGRKTRQMIRGNYESDAGKRKEIPHSELGTIPHMPFEEYQEKCKHFLTMKRENGILEARLHTNGDSLVWNAQAHQGLHYFFDWAGRDPDNEVIILGGSGKDLFKGIGRVQPDGSTGYAHEFDSAPENAWRLYDYQYYDGTNDIEGQVFDVEVPTIGVWNGAAFHTDLVLFSDITLCTEDAWTTEMHYRVNMVPGDGIQIAWRELMGRKRFAYAELTGEIITARKALELGMVNENLRGHRGRVRPGPGDRRTDHARRHPADPPPHRPAAAQAVEGGHLQRGAQRLRHRDVEHLHRALPARGQLLGVGARGGRAGQGRREEGQGRPSAPERRPGRGRDQVVPTGRGARHSAPAGPGPDSCTIRNSSSSGSCLAS
ncbi:MAG: enoyl-CoA hydratase/isomerase family protein [Propionicimonas sp.]|uniref:enoyl-CoA hydratase/isomerase family protein n=1 Tax=Propionicimonas sp. TaxID=1955623 RepID=UPI003D103BE8